MPYGHWGKLLRVNLSTGAITVESYDDIFLRRYVGGWGFIAYHLLKEVPAGCDPLGPQNKLIITTGAMTGQPVAGGGRHMIGGKSPLTGGFGAGECGGYFGAELKRAGWDTVIIEGVSPTPVYLWIKDDHVELRSAEHLWGRETLDVQQSIREEMDEKWARVAQIGTAGEKLARIANIIHDVNRAVGRTGMGAVMGSKRLRAVAVRGSSRPPTADVAKVSELGKWFRDHFQETGSAVFATLATLRMVRNNNNAGGLPTRNFQEGVFEGFEKLSAENQIKTVLVDRDSCFGCPIRCKWVVEVKEPEYPVRREYGGPEYETTGAFGSLCGIDDNRVTSYANQLCNANGLDTIGTGAAIALAIECSERGLLTPDRTDGLHLRFGDGATVIELIKRTVRREGFGDILAEGSWRLAQWIGGEAANYTVTVKGQDLAMHDPRVKYGHGLGVAVSPTGADHMHSLHDNGYQTVGGIHDIGPLGVIEPLAYDDLSPAKVRLVRQVMLWRVLDNVTGICMFQAWSPQQKVDLISATTGWNTSVLELWQAAERAYDMARAFNAREGFGPEDDRLPERIMQPLPAGPVANKVIDKTVFADAIKKLYAMMGWDPDTAAPTRTKLEELGIAWVADLLEGQTREETTSTIIEGEGDALG
ncbi:MAG: aldehyde ferredoxin oxidoreductase family protein [Anaerolineae bacterium]